MGNNKRKKYKNQMSESKEVVDALDNLFGMVPNPDWFTK